MSGRPSTVLVGALVKVFINNRLYESCQSIQYSIDYGETPIYGIDSPLPQEIATGKMMVSGSIQGLRMKNSSTLKSTAAVPAIKDFLLTPYISIRIQDRQSGEDILFIPSAKIRNQNVGVAAKGVVKINFSFLGIMPLEAPDRVP